METLISGSTQPTTSYGQTSKTFPKFTPEHWLTYSRTEAQSVPEECLVIAPDRLVETCPSSEWQRIRDYLSLGKQIIPLAYKDQFDAAQSPHKIDVSDRTSIRELSVTEDESYLSSGPRPLAATTQHAAISNALTSTGALWFLSLTNVTARKGHGSPLSDQTDAVHTISGS